MILPLLKKLNFKDHSKVVLLNTPSELIDLQTEWSVLTQVETSIENVDSSLFFFAFVQTKSQLIEIAPKLEAIVKNDGIIWFAYPKLSSKRYKSEINRDSGWESLGNLGLEGVRAVAINEDWSALRFRHVDFIKSFTRNDKMVLSKEGKSKKNAK